MGARLFPGYYYIPAFNDFNTTEEGVNKDFHWFIYSRDIDYGG